MDNVEKCDSFSTQVDENKMPELVDKEKKYINMSATTCESSALKLDEVLIRIRDLSLNLTLLLNKVSDFSRYTEIGHHHKNSAEYKIADFEKQFERFLKKLEQRETEFFTRKLAEIERRLYARPFNGNEMHTEDFVRHLQKKNYSLSEDNEKHVEKIAVMEEQLRMRTEDFLAERKDRERAVMRLQELQHEVTTLGDELDIYRNRNAKPHRRTHCCRDREGMIEQCD